MVGLGGQVVILVVGGRWVLDGALEIGELVAFVLYLTAFFAPIQQMVQLYNTYQQGQASVRKLRDLFAEQPSVAQRPGAPTLPELDGEVRLEHVTFEYRPGRPVLHDVDLTIPAGETFAFVGETGAGKSTIAKLVNRLYDPTAGAVLLDGVDIRDVTLASVRRQVGAVPQEAFLFGGSIRANVSFARPDASERTRWSRPAGWSASATCSTGCRTASTRPCTSAACRCPRGSGSCSHWPAPSSPGRGSSCSTRPRRTSTSGRRPASRRRSTRCSRAARPSSSPTGWRRRCGPTASRSSTTGGSWSSASHAELLAAGGRYAAMVDTWQAHA